MREQYDYPAAEEPIAEVTKAIELDDFYSNRKKKKMSFQSDTFITKYRPVDFNEILGNKVAITSLEEALKSQKPPHAFLLSGHTGSGKTTTARIIAKHVNAFIQEIDAATQGGVDRMRELSESCEFRPVTSCPNRLIIIDECHALGPPKAAAWKPLLKLLEDCKSYTFFCLCTTEPSAIPEPIKDRCFPVPLKPLKSQEIEELITLISDLEGWELENDVFAAIVQASEGSARKALSILEAGHATKSREELGQIVVEVETEDSPAMALASFLIRGGTDWKQIAKMLERIEDYDAAITLMNRTFASAMQRSTDDGIAATKWKLLQAFSESNGWDSKVKLYTAIGRILWN